MADTNQPIWTIRIHFKQHWKHKFSTAHVHLNNYFAHSLPIPEELYIDTNQLTFHPNFADIIHNQSIDVITEDICAATGAPVEEVNLKIKQRLNSSILTWLHDMNNTQL